MFWIPGMRLQPLRQGKKPALDRQWKLVEETLRTSAIPDEPPWLQQGPHLKKGRQKQSKNDGFLLNFDIFRSKSDKK
jgi:hypothetical protein